MERIKPVNRHILIIPHTKKNETNAGVLLPDDYEEEHDAYVTATVVDIADDCGKQFKHLSYGLTDGRPKKIIVDKSMIQEVKLKDNKFYLILENFVVGIYRKLDEG